MVDAAKAKQRSKSLMRRSITGIIGADRWALTDDMQMLFKAPFSYYVDTEDSWKMLARAFSVVSFSEGQTLPRAPFYYIVNGEVAVKSSDGVHESCRHGASEFVVSVDALQIIRGAESGIRGGFWSRILGRGAIAQGPGNWVDDDSQSALPLTGFDAFLPQSQVVAETDGRATAV